MTAPTPFPIEPNEDVVLDHIVRLWAESARLSGEASDLEEEARNLRAQSEDKLDEADTLADPLIEAHPGWEDLLDNGEDPRVAIAEAEFNEAMVALEDGNLSSRGEMP